MNTIDLSVVVAVYNEHPENLVRLLDRLAQVLVPVSVTYEVVFVNDGSRAETSKALQQLALERQNVKLVVLSRNFGQQAAISAGLDHAQGRAIVNIDSDLQDPPELIPEMLKYWRAGYDVVYAQRSSRRDRVFKRLTAFIFYRILASVSTVEIPWDTGDFRLIDQRVVHALNKLPEKTRFLRGQIPWLGFRQIGIPIDRGAREVGESTYTLKKLIQLAMDGLLALSSAPLYLIPSFGVLVFVAGLIGLSVSLIAQIGTVPVLNNADLLSALAALTGMQIIALGLVAVYLARVLDETRARPTYLVSELIQNGKRFPDDNRELPEALSGSENLSSSARVESASTVRSK